MLLLCCKQFYASLDESVQLEMLLCSCKWSYASFDGSVRLEMLLCSWKQFYASLDGSVRQEIRLRISATGNALMQLETILCEFGQISATGNALMQLETILCKFEQISATGNAHILLETILCKFGQICATGNPVQWLTVGRNSILNFPAKIWTGMCRALLTSDDSSHSQSQSRKRLLLASKGHPARTPPYQWSCIDPTYLSHPLDPTPDAPRS